jgi:hypothetical protein
MATGGYGNRLMVIAVGLKSGTKSEVSETTGQPGGRPAMDTPGPPFLSTSHPEPNEDGRMGRRVLR